jgi:hypothetical protein
MNKIVYQPICLMTVMLVSVLGFGQVGINTNSPKGILDLQANATTGLIYPRVPLQATNTSAPVVNPAGGPLEPGTVVYNTSLTTNGTNDVYPGIYAWDGTKWATQFIKEDIYVEEQSSLDYRVPISGGYRDVPGLGGGSTFTPKYSGTYRIIANFNFGAGEIKQPPSGGSPHDFISMATQEGFFRFTFDSDDYEIYTHSYSVFNEHIGSAPGTVYDSFRHDSSLIIYEDLVAGQTYNFRLEIDVFVSNSTDYDNGDPNSYSHVGIELPCTVEFTYLEGN